ncbi:MAG: hypothetical protein KGJ86_11225 [Chloroflexota bacterium]|nr:hypothetical protein [Chloroflexota bacterium]
MAAWRSRPQALIDSPGGVRAAALAISSGQLIDFVYYVMAVGTFVGAVGAVTVAVLPGW